MKKANILEMVYRRLKMSGIWELCVLVERISVWGTLDLVVFSHFGVFQSTCQIACNSNMAGCRAKVIEVRESGRTVVKHISATFDLGLFQFILGKISALVSK